MIPRARLIHSKVWQSEQVQSLKISCRLLYIGMITLADDEGRLPGSGKFLRAQLLPGDRVGVKKVEKMRDEIEKANLIAVYRKENSVFIQHPKWSKYQTLRRDRSRLSQYPAPTSGTVHPDDRQTTAEDKVSQDNRTEAKIIEANAGTLSPREKMELAKKRALKKFAMPDLASSGPADNVSSLPHEVALLIDN